MVMFNYKGQEYSIDGFLKQKLENIKDIQSKGWDCFFVIDGLEGSGKSTLAQICACYLDANFPIENICIDSDDAIKKLETVPDGSTLIIDEGSMLFASRDSMQREQRKLIKICNVIRQKRLILIVVLPSFFDMNKYISIHRSKFLLHVYTDAGMRRGRFAYFGEKAKRLLYELGKKNFNSYSRPRADFVSSFTDFSPFGEEYLKTKRKTLFSALHQGDEKTLDRRNIEKIVLKRAVKNMMNHKDKPTQTVMGEYLGLGLRTISEYAKEIREEAQKSSTKSPNTSTTQANEDANTCALE